MIVNPAAEERKKLEEALLNAGYKLYNPLTEICEQYDQNGHLKVVYEEKKRALKIQGHPDIINVDTYCPVRNSEGKLDLYIKYLL